MIAGFADRWHEIEPLLDRLFDIPAGERAAWLDRHCSDAALRALVLSALENAQSLESLERGVVQWLPVEVDEAPAVTALPRVPGYRAVGFVGAGGMASVFKAVRLLPGGPQTVALKLLRINVHDPDERRRFLREQRILARLQHPHIAQLLDAGFTAAGAPFLALELVDGDRITRFCDRRRLDIRARLAVFADVCAAVEHAHRNLIVHRDLKPTNVLVRSDGCVKLLDFGIAKLLTDDDATRTEAQRLTRIYAAPEQLAGAATTTAIDVHALGVLLAEIVSGRRPERAGDGPCDIVLDALDEATAWARGLSAAALRRRLDGDLRAIVRKATQHDPVRRYATVAALREDIDRHLEGLALLSRSDTLVYRVAMFVRRHRVGVSTAVAAVSLLAGATFFSAHQAAIARREALRAELQAHLAKDETARADAVKSFLEGLFDNAAPGTATAGSAEEILARGRERADRDFAAMPALRVEILALVGDLERRSGHADHAREPLEDAATLAKRELGASDVRTLHVEYLLAEQADETGRVRDAVARLQSALDDFRASGPRDSKEEVEASAWLAGLYERIGDSKRAVSLGRQALTMARRALPADSAALTEAITNFGWILMDAGHAEDAVPLLSEGLERKRRLLGAEHVDVADAMTLLTSAELVLGRYAAAERLMRGAVAIDANAYAKPHPHVAWHLNDLANALALEGKLDEAAAFYEKALAIDHDVFPGGDIGGANSRANLAKLRFEQGRHAEAEAGLRAAIAEKLGLLGRDYVDNGGAYDKAWLARILIPLDHWQEAGALIDQSIAGSRKRHGDAHVDIAFALLVQAELFAARGEHAAAADRARDAVTMYASLMPANYARTTLARLVLGENLHELGRDAEAKNAFDAALTSARATDPPNDAVVARAVADLAHVAELTPVTSRTSSGSRARMGYGTRAR